MDSMLVDALECSICLEQLNIDNRVLPCQHTFCTTCLEAVKNKEQERFSCPECRLPVIEEINQLPSNIILKRVLENLSKVHLSASKNKKHQNHYAEASCSSSPSSSKKLHNTPTKSPSTSFSASQSVRQNHYAEATCTSSPFSSQKLQDTPSKSPSTSFSASPSVRQNLIPCTVEKINRILYGMEGKVNGMIPNKIVLVGRIDNVQVMSSSTEFDLDDGTGVAITIRHYHHYDDSKVLTENTYMKVIVRIQMNRGKKNVVALDVKQLQDMNELTSHMLEIVHNSVSIEKLSQVNLAEIHEDFVYYPDSSDEEMVSTSKTSTNTNTAKRRILVDSESGSETDDMQLENEPLLRTPAKKARRRIIPTIADSSESSSEEDFNPITSSSARKNKKKAKNISSSESEENGMDENNMEGQDSNHYDSNTDPLSDDALIRGAEMTPDKPIPENSGSRSSVRVKDKKEFHMPSRKDLFDAIDKTPVTEKSYEELKQRKVVNDFTKINNRYNYDPNYTSGESSFIEDEFEYIDYSSLVSEDSNYEPEPEKKGNNKNSVNKKKTTTKSRKTRTKQACISGSDSELEQSSDYNKNKVKHKGRGKKSRKTSESERSRHRRIKQDSTSSSDDDFSDITRKPCNGRARRTRDKNQCGETSGIASRKSESSSSYSEIDSRKTKNKKADLDNSFQSESDYNEKRNQGRYYENEKTDSDSYSDIGESSRSILSKVSERSKTMSNKRREKESTFDDLKRERALKSTKKK